MLASLAALLHLLLSQMFSGSALLVCWVCCILPVLIMLLGSTSCSRAQVTEWFHSHKVFPGEPQFVPDPKGTAEDAGALLSVVLDGRANTSFLLILDASEPPCPIVAVRACLLACPIVLFLRRQCSDAVPRRACAFANMMTAVSA